MKNVLVTGANGGLGKALTTQLVKNGYFVYRADIKTAEEMDNTLQIVTDVTSMDSVNELKNKISETTDSLYAVINVAGMFNMDSLIEIEEKDFIRIFNINFFGAFRINKVMLPLIRKGNGRVIMVTSELAPLYPLPFECIYALTKSSLDNYAQALRMELQLLDVPVSVVRPGAIDTGLLNVSTTALDRLCAKTELYSYNADKFRKIVNNTEAKAVPPAKVASVIMKAVNAKKPKYTYKINANFMLKLLNILPKKTQVWVIKQILKTKNKK